MLSVIDAVAVNKYAKPIIKINLKESKSYRNSSFIMNLTRGQNFFDNESMESEIIGKIFMSLKIHDLKIRIICFFR